MLVSAIAAVSLAAADPKSAFQREAAMWEMVKQKQMNTFASMLMPNFVGIGSHGVVDRATEIELVGQGQLLSYKMSDFTVDQVDTKNILVTYKADLDALQAGKDVPVRIQVATLWHRMGGKWLMAYHSGFGIHRDHVP